MPDTDPRGVSDGGGEGSLTGFKRREFHERLDLCEFVDPTGLWVGAFASPNPSHPSSVAALSHLYGYRPADPQNPEHRRMFPKAQDKDGYLKDLDGNIAMIYPKKYYDEYHAARAKIDSEDVLGTGKTEGADIRDPAHAEKLGAAVAAVGAAGSTRPGDAEIEREVERQIQAAMEGQPAKATAAVARKLETNQRDAPSK